MEPVYCACGVELNEPPNVPVESRQPCPRCGSTARVRHVKESSTASYYTRLRAQQKRPGIRGWLVDLIEGWELRKSVGDMVQKFRLIDKRQRPGHYAEKVTTADGEVIHDVDEPLSKHRGRGSAKDGFSH